MKRLFAALALSALLMGRCTPATVHMFDDSSQVSGTQETGYVPLNYEYQQSMWLPYLSYGELMNGKDADSFRSAVRKRFTEAAENGINTLYIHIRPTGDAYYDSSLFPKGEYNSGVYDPFGIMLDEAHELGLSVHGWINPLRLQTIDEMASVPDSFITKQWYSQGKNTGIANGRVWLRPDSPEVLDLIADEVTEIIQKYDVDGIHIDDYFYPDTDPAFDAEAFAMSGEDDLTKWRTEVVSQMVRTMYNAVKAADKNVLFGVSPQGNIRADYETQYADVRRWTSEEGFCDYIVPQIYYGFRNETLPFTSVLEEWERMAGNGDIRLVIGLAAYKQGKEDQWAGAAGENEWIEDPTVIERQKDAVISSSADGYALYY